MKYHNYRTSFTKIFTYAGSLPEISLLKLQKIITHTKCNFLPVFVMNKKAEAEK